MEAKSDDEDNSCFSFNTIKGVEGTTSIRIHGQLEQKTLKILMNNGSTHDFLDYDFARGLEGRIMGSNCQQWR